MSNIKTTPEQSTYLNKWQKELFKNLPQNIKTQWPSLTPKEQNKHLTQALQKTVKQYKQKPKPSPKLPSQHTLQKTIQGIRNFNNALQQLPPEAHWKTRTNGKGRKILQLIN